VQFSRIERDVNRGFFVAIFVKKRERNPRAVPSKLSSAAYAHSLAPDHRRSTTHVRKYDFVVSLLDPDTR